MDKLNLLKLKKILSEYDYLVSDKEYKSEIIDSEKPAFLKVISERVKELSLTSIDDVKEDTKESKKENKEKKKIEDSEISKETKSSIKSMFRKIVKITHPDRIGSDHMLEYYTSAKEAYDLNDLLQICLISSKLNLEIEINEEELDILFSLIKLKKKEIESLEKSWLWAWLTSKSDEEKMIIIDSYCKANFVESTKNNEIPGMNKTDLSNLYSTSPYRNGYLNKTEFAKEYSEVYGEVTEESTNCIVSKFKSKFNKDTVFYDLGCGLGKMVIHIGLQYSPKKSCGIELSKERIKGALDLKKEYADTLTNIEFIESDFFSIDFSDATVIYIDNTAMTHDIARKIIEKMPSGCTLICRKKPQDEHVTTIKDEGLKTTYGKDEIHYLTKP